MTTDPAGGTRTETRITLAAVKVLSLFLRQLSQRDPGQRDPAARAVGGRIEERVNLDSDREGGVGVW